MNEGDDIQVVTFRVGPQEFAFDILQVERILRYTAPSPLPKASKFLEGVMPYGDGAVPVLDLRKRFELDASIREETRMMVLELETQRVAVLVDEVREVMRVHPDRWSGDWRPRTSRESSLGRDGRSSS
jgi:purine-binding chemotaxis protein CheW